jgi:hypothetical protein
MTEQLTSTSDKAGVDNLKSVGFEVLTAVVMKNYMLWNITPCSPLNIKTNYMALYPRRQNPSI